MMMSLLVLSGASLFFLHLLSETQASVADCGLHRRALHRDRDRPGAAGGAEGDPKVVLDAYAEKLRKLGVKDVSIADAADEVQASTNPKIVGKRLVRKKKPGRGVRHQGRAGRRDLRERPDDLHPHHPHRWSATGGWATLLITRTLDDFSALSHEAFLSRLIATLGVFAVGMLLSLYLAWSLQPAAAGADRGRAPGGGGRPRRCRCSRAGGDEIASLSRTFNEMVERLRENRRLEERLHFAERSTALGPPGLRRWPTRSATPELHQPLDRPRAPAAGPGRARAAGRLRPHPRQHEVARSAGSTAWSGTSSPSASRCASTRVPARWRRCCGRWPPSWSTRPRDQGIAPGRGGGARPAPGRGRPRAAQDLLPEPDDQRRRRHARTAALLTVGHAPRARTAGARSGGRRCSDTGQGMTPEEIRDRLRAVLLDQGHRPRPGPRPDPQDRRRPRRHHRARERARTGHHASRIAPAHADRGGAVPRREAAGGPGRGAMKAADAGRRRRAAPARHPADDPGGRGLRGHGRGQRPPGPGGGRGAAAFDVVLTDLKMPDKSGIELLERAARRPSPGSA